MSLTPQFIRIEIENQRYLISLHAHQERLADGLTIAEIETALADCQILETYSEDPRGESCLALGYVQNKVEHFVCGKTRAEHLILITVYVPSMPKWEDPYTRNRSRSL